MGEKLRHSPAGHLLGVQRVDLFVLQDIIHITTTRLGVRGVREGDAAQRADGDGAGLGALRLDDGAGLGVLDLVVDDAVDAGVDDPVQGPGVVLVVLELEGHALLPDEDLLADLHGVHKGTGDRGFLLVVRLGSIVALELARLEERDEGCTSLGHLGKPSACAR